MMLKKILALASLTVGLANIALGAPYVVYSGTTVGGSFTTAGPAATSKIIYLMIDVADSSNYAILEVDAVTKAANVSGFPIANATAEQAATNFLGGINAANGKSGLVVFSSSATLTDSSNNLFVARAYGTGPLVMKQTVLAAARVVPAYVHRRTNGVFGNYVTLSPAAAVYAASGTIPSTITGSIFGYSVASTGSLTLATGAGTFTLKMAPGLTAYANTGGSIAIGLNTSAILPVDTTNTTVSDALVNWLTEVGDCLGYSFPVTGNGSTFSGGTIVSGGTISIGATSTGGLTVVGSGTGTLVLTGTTAGTFVGTTTGTSTGTGVLGLNNTGTGTTTSTGTFTIGTGTLTINPGTIGLGSTTGTATLGTTSSGTLTISPSP